MERRSLFTKVTFIAGGFGIVEENRLPKPAASHMVAMFRQLDNILVEQLWAARPTAEVQLFWSTNADMVWRVPTGKCHDLGRLKRLGFQLRIIDDGRSSSAYTCAGLLLSAASRWIRVIYINWHNVISAGIHSCQADLPGHLMPIAD